MLCNRDLYNKCGNGKVSSGIDWSNGVAESAESIFFLNCIALFKMVLVVLYTFSHEVLVLVSTSNEYRFHNIEFMFGVTTQDSSSFGVRVDKLVTSFFKQESVYASPGSQVSGSFLLRVTHPHSGPLCR